jgi:5-methyltetrahydropteroyltriglutamate--homocysteine methyltransferase
VTGAVIPTTLVGSYPQPDWLIDREALAKRLPPRLRARELWRIDPQWLREAQDDAVALAVRDQERAGLDIITDGEVRRESYSNHFANALDGIDLERPGTIRSRAGTAAPVPRVTGPMVRREPVHVADLDFLRSQTDRPVKVTVPGPFTMSQQAQNDFYEHEEALVFAYADVVREELDDLFAAGADVVQLDEPWMEARPEAARRLALPALERALDGVRGTTALHICFGYPAFVPDHPPAYSFLTELADSSVNQISIEAAQSGEQVAGHLRRALEHMPAEQLAAAPDCGMKYLWRDVAFAKLQAMVAGARQAAGEAQRRPVD